MAIAFRNVFTSANTAVSSLNITVPSTVVNGDLMLLTVGVQSGSRTITTPTGWTVLQDTPISTLGRKATYYRVAVGAEASTVYTISIVGGTARIDAAIVAYSGVDTLSPINVSSGQANASSTSIVAPTVTTTVGNTRLVFLGTTIVGASGITPPTGETERADYGPASSMRSEVADETIATASATGTRTATGSSAGENAGHLVALNPIVSGAGTGDAGTGADTTAGASTSTQADAASGTDTTTHKRPATPKRCTSAKPNTHVPAAHIVDSLACWRHANTNTPFDASRKRRWQVPPACIRTRLAATSGENTKIRAANQCILCVRAACVRDNGNATAAGSTDSPVQCR